MSVGEQVAGVYELAMKGHGRPMVIEPGLYQVVEGE